MWSFAVPAVTALVLTLLPTAATSTAATDGADATRTTTQTERTAATVARTVPSGFTDSAVERVGAPTGLAWTPDGRLLVTSKPGRLVVRDGGTRTTALDITGRVCKAFEQGLEGVAVDPEFAVNHFVYVFYTHRVRGHCGGSGHPRPASRVSRFVLGSSDTIARSSEQILADHIPSPSGHHLAGDLEFGTDGYLYITVGDGMCSVVHRSRCMGLNDNAQRRYLPLGKVLRVTRAGRPAPGNPYADRSDSRWCTRPSGVPRGTGPCKEIFATGLRNPFRFALKPDTNIFYVNDVGQDTWEEVDRLRSGANYGWNVREGHCRRGSTTRCGTVPGYTNPVYDYRHRHNCESITGGAFAPNGAWPGWDDAYVYADFVCNKIFRLQPRAGGGFDRTLFASGLDRPVALKFGPYAGGTALYYLAYGTGTVRRIARSAPATVAATAGD